MALPEFYLGIMIHYLVALFFLCVLSATPVAASFFDTFSLKPSTTADRSSQARNGVVLVAGGCTGTLISPNVILTVAHCVGLEARVPRPVVARSPDCTGLDDQVALQRNAWENPRTWYDTSWRVPVSFGPVRDMPEKVLYASHYSLPRCADLVLLLLKEPAPRAIATPIPVLRMTSPEKADALLRYLPTATLRYSGWGKLGNGLHTPTRKTGPLGYWSENRCSIFALPPSRGNGRRIMSGDSGSPLLVRQPDGTEAVAGVLFGSSVVDEATCGTPAPLPPRAHGTYTTVWRPGIDGTNATDIGVWLEQMVSDARGAMIKAAPETALKEFLSHRITLKGER
jgi:hypothetical protein